MASPVAARMRVAVVVLLASSATCACDRRTPTPAARGEVTVHVPGALRIARGLDTLSVEIDPASRADTTVSVANGMILGVETATQLFAVGDARGLGERRSLDALSDFRVGPALWSTSRDDVPEPDKRYVAEMTLVLFETDVPSTASGDAARDWNPHAGRYRELLRRTIRQAEE